MSEEQQPTAATAASTGAKAGASSAEAPEGTKANYKKTKLGWIPKEWEVKSLGKLFDFRNGYNADSNAYGRGIQFVNVLEVITHTELNEELIPGRVEIGPDAHELNSVKHGDVLFNRTSETPEEVGLTSVYTGSTTITFGGFVIRGRQTTDLFDTNYLKYGLRIPWVRKQIIAKSNGAVRSNIGQADLREVLTLLPPPPEQRRIAAILGTWDRAIATVQRLLAAQQKRKRGLMQEMLSGKRRFEEYEPKEGMRYVKTRIGMLPSDWKTARAGTVFRNVSVRGKSGPLLAVTQDQGVVRRDQLERRVVMPEGSTAGYKFVDIGDFVISLRTFQGGIEWSSVSGLVSPAYTVLALTSEAYLPEFVALYFKSYNFIERLSAAVIGIRDGKNISFPDFKIQLLPQPSIEEQKKIVAAIDEADRLIKQTETHLAHLAAQKRGLMQQLLTGRVRVKTD